MTGAAAATDERATLEDVRVVLDRLWSGEQEIVAAYLERGVDDAVEQRWTQSWAWRAFVHANLFVDGMQLAQLAGPNQAISAEFVVGGRELYMKWRAFDVLTSLYEELAGISVTGFDLVAEAAVEEWGGPGRKLDALLAAVRVTADPEADAVIRLIGEMGFGACYELARRHPSPAVKGSALTMLSDGCRRLSYRLRRLVDAAEGRVSIDRSSLPDGLDFSEDLYGIAKAPYAIAVVVAQLVAARQLAVRNGQFGQPLSDERLRELMQEKPKLTTSEIASMTHFEI